jgi:hypothetical protein
MLDIKGQHLPCVRFQEELLTKGLRILYKEMQDLIRVVLQQFLRP